MYAHHAAAVTLPQRRALSVKRTSGQASTSDGTARDAALVAPEEIGAAAVVLAGTLSLPDAELARETASLFGIARLGKLVEERMQAGIDLLCQQGRTCRIRGRVEWRGA